MRGFKGDLKAFCIETPHKVRNKMEKAFSNKHHMHFLSFKKSFRFVAKVTLKMLLSHLSLFQMPTNHPPTIQCRDRGGRSRKKQHKAGLRTEVRKDEDFEHNYL